jgi:hypothetical protein
VTVPLCCIKPMPVKLCKRDDLWCMLDAMAIVDGLSEKAFEACDRRADGLLGGRLVPTEGLNRRQHLVLKLLACGLIAVGVIDEPGDRMYVLHHEAWLNDMADIGRAPTLQTGRLIFSYLPLLNSEEAQLCNRALVFDARKLRAAVLIRPSAEAEVVRTIRALKYTRATQKSQRRSSSGN